MTDDESLRLAINGKQVVPERHKHRRECHLAHETASPFVPPRGQRDAPRMHPALIIRLMADSILCAAH